MLKVYVKFHKFFEGLCLIDNKLDILPGDYVIVETKDGIDLGIIDEENVDLPEVGVIVRKATFQDIEVKEKLKEIEKQSLNLFENYVKKLKYKMKPIDVHLWFNNKKIAFYFTAEKRLDFRKLHKIISDEMHKRVVIKQVGIRDYTRTLGGIGLCGRTLCCIKFLKEPRTVSLRMARQQNLYVSTSKITGACGRLLCCLDYEYEHKFKGGNFEEFEEFVDSEDTGEGTFNQ